MIPDAKIDREYEAYAKTNRNWDSVARRYVEHDTTAQETFGVLGPRTGDNENTQLVDVRSRIEGEIATAFNLNSPRRRGDFMQTYTARQFWPLDARPDEVHIEDIAHALSLQCRYAGHCLKFYSVAEHSVMLARWLTEMGESDETALTGLLHDATEAYLVDVPRPVKRSLHDYRLHEAALWKVVAERYGLPEVMPAIVHEADDRIIADELVNLRPMPWHAKHDNPLHVDLQFWSPAEAEAEFLAAYHALENMRRAA